MNETVGLLQKSAAFLVRNPIVLVPVLVARTADFLTYWISALLRGPALKVVAPRSVLGGFSGKVNGPLLLVAGLFTILPLVVEVALLLYSMVVTGRWAHRLREGSEEFGTTDANRWWAPASELARATALTLAVGAITALVGLFLSLHGGVPVRWSYVVTWCFLLMASWFVLPAWLRLLARAQGVRVRDVSRLPPFIAVVLGLVGFAAFVYLGGQVQLWLANAHKIQGVAAPFAINYVAACLSAVSLAFSFVAMSRHVADRPGWTEA